MTIRLHLKKEEGKLRKKTGSLEYGHLKIPGQQEPDVSPVEPYFESVYQKHDLKIQFGKKQFLCQICNSASNLKDFYQDI